MTVELKVSGDFCLYVVYSPKDENFVCVEPQTCSIDAHNLHEKGFEYNNLLFAPPKQTVSGCAVITVKSM